MSSPLVLPQGLPLTPPTTPAVVFDVLGTNAANNTGTITPTQGASVFCDVYIGNGSIISPASTACTYNDTPMILVGQTDIGTPSTQGWYRYWMPNVSGQTATVTATPNAGAVAGWIILYSYKNVGEVFFNPAMLCQNLTAWSVPVTPPTNGMAVWGVTGNQTISSMSGGTSRALNTGAAYNLCLREASSATSLVTNTGSIANLGGLLTYLSPVTRTGIYLYSLWNGVEQGKGSPTMSIQVPPKSLVIVDIGVSASTVTAITYGPSSTAMTLNGSAGFNGNTAAGVLYRYYIFDTTGGFNTITVTSGGDTWLTAMVYQGVSSIAPATTASGLATTPATATQSATCSAGQKIVQTFATDTIQNQDASGNNLVWTPSGGTNLTNYTSDGTSSRLMTVSESDVSTTFTATCNGAGSAHSTGNYAGLASVLS